MQTLILFKFPLHWNEDLIRKFTLIGSVDYLFLNQFSRGLDKSKVILSINKKIQYSKIDAVIFDTDFQFYVDKLFISQIDNNVIKIGITFDDVVLRRFNEITFEACDLVLTPDLLAVYKYQEIGKPSALMLLEGSSEIYYTKKSQKKIDVFHFGSREKADRSTYLNYLIDNGVSVVEPTSWISQGELVDLINSAKIVINFSKTNFLDLKNTVLYDKKGRHKYLYQFKGRVIEAGLCGTACVSEYSPMSDIIFADSELAIFSTKEECLKIVNELLGDPNKRELMAFNLQKKILSLYEDSVTMPKIKSMIDDVRLQKGESLNPNANTPPFAYLKSIFKANMHKNLVELNPVNFAVDSHFFYRGYGFGLGFIGSCRFFYIFIFCLIELIIAFFRQRINSINVKK